MLRITEQIQGLIDAGALFVSNHSGGKDSQAMYELLKKVIPASQLVVIHAHLPEVEWEGTLEHLQATVEHELFIVQAVKTFFQMVEHRQKFPSSQQRQCTSDLKRNPIETKIRQISIKRGIRLIVNCMGMRAQESSKRAKRAVFKQNLSNTNGRRTWYDWLPIHHLTTKQVFEVIAESGQKPHWVYSAGMTRKSCCFCIMSSAADLKTAAKLKPELYKRYCSIEKQIDHTLIMPSAKKGRQFLPDIVEGKATKQSNQLELF